MSASQAYYVTDSPHDALYSPTWRDEQYCLKCNQQHPNAPPRPRESWPAKDPAR